MSSFSWLKSEELATAFEEKKPLKIANAVSNIAHCYWEDIHKCINDKTIWLDPGAYIIEEIDYTIYEWVKVLEQEIVKVFPPRTGDVTTHLYVSLFEGCKTLGEHMDTADVFYVGGIGNTSFSINNITYQIAPGDIMYIPRSVNHTPQPQAARAGFSIGLEHGRHDT